MVRVLFSALAVIDAGLLAYLALSYDWLVWSVPTNFSTPAGWIIIVVLWALLVAEKAFFAAYFALIGWAVGREIRGKRDASRWAAVPATLVLLAGLAGIAAMWIPGMREIINGPPGFLIDRLTLFDGLARTASHRGGLFGTDAYFSGSIGASLITLLGAVYLTEKYLFAWWRVRWPVPLLPILALGWVTWGVLDGERRLREYVAQQQWRPLPGQQTWLAAIDTCSKLGTGWRLPRREELARYLSTGPAEMRERKDAAWTATAIDGEGWAVAVDLAARRSGRWNRNSEPTRDESLCEYRDERGYAHDWFAALRTRVCEHTTLSAYLYTPGAKATAYQTGNVAVTQSNGAVVCVRPADDAARIGVRTRRGYRGEQDFVKAEDFLAYMAKKCGPSPVQDVAACFVYSPDLPAFEESGDERLMRAFCELDRNGEGCHRYALLMDRHPEAAERAARYRDLACKRGYKPACPLPAAVPAIELRAGHEDAKPSATR